MNERGVMVRFPEGATSFPRPPESTPALSRTHPSIQCIGGRFLKPSGLDLTTNLQLQPWLRMRGAIPLQE